MTDLLGAGGLIASGEDAGLTPRQMDKLAATRGLQTSLSRLRDTAADAGMAAGAANPHSINEAVILAIADTRVALVRFMAAVLEAE